MQCPLYFIKYFENTLYKMNDCFESVRLIHWNFLNGLFNYIQACNYFRLKLLFNFYAKRTVHRQNFGAPIEDMLKLFQLQYVAIPCFIYSVVGGAIVRAVANKPVEKKEDSKLL